MKGARVAVTGLGLMTGLGLDLETSWKNLLSGERPARRFSLFDPAGLPCTFGVELPEGASELFAAQIITRSRRQMTRGTMMAVVSAQAAIQDAGLDSPELNRSRIGVVIGGTTTGYIPPDTQPDEHRILRNMASAPAGWISLKNHFTGPSLVVSTACSSGVYALHTGFGLIASGECDIVICGASDCSLNYLDVQGFSALMALSTATDHFESASRPFDRNRTGFVMGEGAGMLVLESADHAARRSARVHALMPLPGVTSEAYNIISPRPEGVGMAQTMRRALEHAGYGPEGIDYINAHGTSTPLNDLYETQAIKTVFGERAKQTPVSSTKSQTGHCLSGAAAVESVLCCKVLEEGVIPATMNLTESDPQLDLDYVPLKPRKADVKRAMCNSFAFGGQNGVVIFEKT